MANKRVLVIGGSGAVGSELCTLLASREVSVAFTFCNREAEARALQERIGNAHALRYNALEANTTEALVERARTLLGGLDALVYCAAVGSASGRYETSMDVDEAGFDRVMAVNVRGAFFACRAFAQHARDANLVLLGSADGVKAVPSSPHYSATKGALHGMVLSLAKEYGSKNLRVNLVAPGILERGLSSILPDETKREYLKHTGLKRFGTLREVAEVVHWFALENTYVTGRAVLLDGGL